LHLLPQGAVLDGLRKGRRISPAAGSRRLVGLPAHTPVEARSLPPFLFCSRCGVRAFTKGGALPAFGGEFHAVNLACLDDATDAELAQAPIQYADGRNDDWKSTPAETRHL